METSEILAIIFGQLSKAFGEISKALSSKAERFENENPFDSLLKEREGNNYELMDLIKTARSVVNEELIFPPLKAKQANIDFLKGIIGFYDNSGYLTPGQSGSLKSTLASIGALY